MGYVVNCTGPECNYHKLKDPLVLQLFFRGLITPDPLFLGIDVGVGGIIHNVYGERVPNLYTLGSPQKGRLLETTAVPALRVQAEDLARRLWQELDRQERAGVAAGSPRRRCGIDLNWPGVFSECGTAAATNVLGVIGTQAIELPL